MFYVGYLRGELCAFARTILTVAGLAFGVALEVAISQEPDAEPIDKSIGFAPGVSRCITAHRIS